MRFILLDDDPVNNTLCRLAIRNAVKGAEIISFVIPDKGLEYISNEGLNDESFLFLDINMPKMTCWEFLDHFEKLDEKVKKKIKIFILSASLSPQDKERAYGNKIVNDYIEKPLTAEKIRKLIL